jgi:uncharacterized membrane protein YphA (DoxX/SURF4 family)
LVIGLAFILLLDGAGKFSIDSLLAKSFAKNQQSTV